MASTKIRRRSAGAILSSSRAADLPIIEEESPSVISDALIDNSKELLRKAAESGYKKKDELIEGLTTFTEAATYGSKEAIDELKRFLVTTSEKRLAFVLDELPRDLLSTAKVLVKGSETEKQVLQVAKDMFKTMSRGKKVIKKDEIDQAAMSLMASEATVVGSEELKSISDLKGSVNRLLKFSLKPNADGEEIVTEEAFCLVACQYARGELVLPLTADDYQLSSRQYQEFKDANWIKKSMEFPKQTAHYVGQYTLKAVEKNGIKWVWSYIPTKQLQLMIFVYLIPLISMKVLSSTLATVVFLCSFLSMIISTLQIVSNWRRINWFMEYSTIFRYFSEHGCTINTKEPETKLLKNTSVPYLSFTISAILAVFTMPLSYQIFVVYEVLFIVSSVMTLFVFMRFKCWESSMLIGSIAVRLLGWSIVFLTVLDKWLPIPEFLFLYGKRIFSISLLSGVGVEINFITIVQVPIQTVLLVYLIVRSSTLQQFLYSVGSYVLFMSWWIFSKQLFSQSSLFQLLLFLPIVFGMFFLAPLTPIVCLFSPIVVFYFYGVSFEFLISLGTVVIVGTVSLLIIVNYKRLKEVRWLNIRLEYLFLIQLALCVPLMYVGSSYYAGIHSPSSLPVVTTDQYVKYCSHTHFGNTIQAQMNCLHLHGRVLNGKARVESVSIGAVQNSYVDMVAKFPEAIRMALTCFIGKKDPFCGDASDSPTCSFKGCHFDSYNRYTVNISATVVMTNNNKPAAANQTPPVNIMLITTVSHDDMLKNSLVLLKQGMIMEFNGTIVSGAGALEGPVLRLNRILASKEDSSGSNDGRELVKEPLSYSPSTNNMKSFIETRTAQVFTEIVDSLRMTIGFILETVFGACSSTCL